MRIYLYLLAGITSALIGWNIGQFFLTDFGLLKEFPEVILFPCIAISLAIGMVMNEIFISNPTRLKLNIRIAKIPLVIAILLGILSGLASGGISQILFLPQIRVPTPIVRMLGWLLIGASVGLAEGLTWQFYSLEAGDKKRFQERFLKSLIFASAASLIAAGLFELIRMGLQTMPPEFRNIEDPIGFSLLGLLLGLAFSITSSPSYIAALRAGKGFEYTGPIYEDIDPHKTVESSLYPSIQKTLKFVSKSFSNEEEVEDTRIEEGLSIQLPPTGKIKIGSAEKADICIPSLPLHSADIEIKIREAILYPNAKFYHTIAINGDRLGTRDPVPLKHNYLLAFYPKEQDNPYDEKVYRFVYYNRFLDPQA
ncbi:hypothetical protein [Gloeothece verrucosa]|uniref:FHA domain-containing protein n=1 Tax=Gloeothece verrucosa (strain PCC 7822) TaxID=497965 RepID=E0UMI1_GLOV7|nr:hypothetical protein [Gloeothece verrucosa]ADN18161.1 conserved hypothetical protein [Gloeothece verrucosa PCC 7822]